MQTTNDTQYFKLLFLVGISGKGLTSDYDIECYRNELIESYTGPDNVTDPWEKAYMVLEQNKKMECMSTKPECYMLEVITEANANGFYSTNDIFAYCYELADSYFGDSSVTDQWERAYRVLKG